MTEHPAEKDAIVVHLPDGMEWQEAAEATRILKELARSTGLPVIVNQRVVPPGVDQ